MQGWNEEIKRLALEKVSNSLEICLFWVTHVNFQYCFCTQPPCHSILIQPILAGCLFTEAARSRFPCTNAGSVRRLTGCAETTGLARPRKPQFIPQLQAKNEGNLMKMTFMSSLSPNVFGEMYRNMWRAPKMTILWHMWTIITSVEHRYPAFSPFQVKSWCQQFAVGRRSGRQGCYGWLDHHGPSRGKSIYIYI